MYWRCDQYKQPENETIHLIHLYSKFEEDVHVNEEKIVETFEEIGLVLLESAEERLYLFGILPFFFINFKYSDKLILIKYFRSQFESCGIGSRCYEWRDNRCTNYVAKVNISFLW